MLSLPQTTGWAHTLLLIHRHRHTGWRNHRQTHWRKKEVDRPARRRLVGNQTGRMQTNSNPDMFLRNRSSCLSSLLFYILAASLRAKCLCFNYKCNYICLKLALGTFSHHWDLFQLLSRWWKLASGLVETSECQSMFHPVPGLFSHAGVLLFVSVVSFSRPVLRAMAAFWLQAFFCFLFLNQSNFLLQLAVEIWPPVTSFSESLMVDLHVQCLHKHRKTLDW